MIIFSLLLGTIGAVINFAVSMIVGIGVRILMMAASGIVIILVLAWLTGRT